jgi:hypothetical protein
MICHHGPTHKRQNLESGLSLFEGRYVTATLACNCYECERWSVKLELSSGVSIYGNDRKIEMKYQETRLWFDNFLIYERYSCSCWDSSVGIATRYELDGPGIESRWGRDFPQPSRPALGPTQPPIQWLPGLFPRDKAAGAWSWTPTPILRRG